MSETKAVDFKEKLVKLADQKRVIRYGERKQIEIIKETKHYKVGQVIAPHTVIAENLIEKKVAKAV